MKYNFFGQFRMDFIFRILKRLLSSQRPRRQEHARKSRSLSVELCRHWRAWSWHLLTFTKH